MSAPTQELAPTHVRWDLSALFSSMDDPKIEAGWSEATAQAGAFEATYRGKIDHDDLTARMLLNALRELEELSNTVSKPVIYGSLLFAADASSSKIGAFRQAQMEKASELQVRLMFFELELQAIPESRFEPILQDPLLNQYRHYLTVTRTFSPYRLSEKEEIVLEQTANTGSRAWVRLFEEQTSNYVYKFKRPGGSEIEELSQEEVVTLLRDSDRAVRQAAADAFSAGLEHQNRLLPFIYNNLIQDKRIEDEMRGHPYPEHSRHLSNELDKDVVDLVVGMCKSHGALVARYYDVKRQILGLAELTHIDRYAPLGEAEEKIPFDRAKEIVLDSFGKFSPELRERAQEFFDDSWIDAEPRQGKTGGAFCSYLTPDTHPVILMSYLNEMNDVGTLAHELGHGVHASFSREQSLFNFHGTLPLAELASIFGEMLVFEKLMSAASLRDQLAMVAEKCEGIFASVYRQAAMFRFEQRCHNERRESGELPPERFGEIWQEELQAMFGSSLKLGEQHKAWWSYVSHFYAVPFYVYAYSFGELLTLAIYEQAKQEGATFPAKYIELLKLGGSRSPDDLMATIGVDLRSKEFWEGGFAAIEAMVVKFEALWAEINS